MSTVDFKQLVVCVTAVKTVKSGHLRDQNKVSTLEGFHFRKVSTLENVSTLEGFHFRNVSTLERVFTLERLK